MSPCPHKPPNREGDQAACPSPWPVWARGRLLLFLGSPMIRLHLPASAEPCLGGACTVTDHTSSLPRPCPGGFAHHLHILPQQVVSSSSHRAQGISPGNHHRDFSVEKQTSHLPPIKPEPHALNCPCKLSSLGRDMSRPFTFSIRSSPGGLGSLCKWLARNTGTVASWTQYAWPCSYPGPMMQGQHRPPLSPPPGQAALFPLESLCSFCSSGELPSGP